MRDPAGSSLRKVTAFATILALGLISSPAALASQRALPPESPIDIAHDPLACMTPVYAPEVDAAVNPGPDYDSGYVYFRSVGEEEYYYARMNGPAATLAAILPRPLPETKAVDYYLRAYDLRTLSKKKGDYTPPVVPGTTCKAKGIPVGPQGAGLTIGLTREGQNPYPPGFNRKDIAKVILVSGAIVSVAEALKASQASAGSSGSSGTTTGAGTAGATGGAGLSTGVIVAGGALIAGGAAAAAVSLSGSKNTPTPTPTPVPTATPTPVIPRFVEADVSWSGPGDIDIQLLNPSGQAVGQTVPAGCESTANRTERVILTGVIPDGTYRVVLSAKSCGAGTPGSISAVVSVQSDSGPKCSNAFVGVPVAAGTIDACQFKIP